MMDGRHGARPPPLLAAVVARTAEEMGAEGASLLPTPTLAFLFPTTLYPPLSVARHHCPLTETGVARC